VVKSFTGISAGERPYVTAKAGLIGLDLVSGVTVGIAMSQQVSSPCSADPPAACVRRRNGA
jgi:hypothetical protein